MNDLEDLGRLIRRDIARTEIAILITAILIGFVAGLIVCNLI